MHYQFSRALKLARKYEIEHWSRSSKTINWSADSFKKKASPQWFDTWARDIVMWYWSVAILFWHLSIDHIVNVQCKRCGFTKTRLRDSSLPFDSLAYPTSTICTRVRTYVRTLDQSRDNQTKEVDHILWVWGSVPRAREARVGAPLKKTFSWFKSSVLVEPIWISLDNLTLFGLSN